ncbi:MAG TPA: cache domain-containing protein [Pyrinomonadaceae bacterium]
MRILAVVILCSVFLSVSCSHLKALHQPKTASTNAESNPTPDALPSGRGTPDEAKAMLAQAVDHYNQVGRTQALADFNRMKSPFGDRDLYVFCLGPDHKVSANGGFAQYVGMSIDVLKDAEGKSLGKAIFDQAQASGEGSIDYAWINPVSQQTENKIAFFRKVGQEVCGVGAYRE